MGACCSRLRSKVAAAAVRRPLSRSSPRPLPRCASRGTFPRRPRLPVSVVAAAPDAGAVEAGPLPPTTKPSGRLLLPPLGLPPLHCPRPLPLVRASPSLPSSGLADGYRSPASFPRGRGGAAHLAKTVTVAPREGVEVGRAQNCTNYQSRDFYSALSWQISLATASSAICMTCKNNESFD